MVSLRRQASAPAGSVLGVDSYLGAMLRILWPEPASIVRIGRFSSPSRTATEFVVLPHLRSPKLVLPRSPRKLTAAALRNYKASATGRARLRLRVLATALRLGAGALLPDRITISYPPAAQDRSIERYLHDVLGTPIRLALYVGPQRAVQKPVFQLLDADGMTFAFVKVGMNRLTQTLVRSEAEALAFLSSLSMRRLVVPELIHHGQWDGHEVLVERAIPPSGLELTATEPLTEAMLELARSRDTETVGLASSTYIAALRKRIAAEEPGPLTELLAASLDRLVAVLGAAPIELGSWHGDWAPWNMVTTPEHIKVWDWEQFESGVPIGFDAVHFQVQDAVVVQGHDPIEAFAATRHGASSLLAPYAIPGDLALLPVVLYAIEIATRYLHDGEIEAGTRMGRIDRWLPPVLEDLLRAIEQRRSP
jgi:hypothetical protein